jgi:hypothetical protein
MMLGKNLKITVDEAQRGRIRTVMQTALDATLKTPATSMDVFVLADGANVGFTYVPADQALTAAQHRLATWFEFVVPDVAEISRRLDALDVERLDYTDKTHPYYIAPGGPVFRLAPRSTP